MSRQAWRLRLPKRRRPSSSRLRATQRLVRSWTHWRLRRVQRRLPKERRRLQLMQHQVDLQLLQLKELEQQDQMLQERLQEQAESLEFRLTGLLTPAPMLPPSGMEALLLSPQETDQLNGRLQQVISPPSSER